MPLIPSSPFSGLSHSFAEEATIREIIHSHSPRLGFGRDSKNCDADVAKPREVR